MNRLGCLTMLFGVIVIFWKKDEYGESLTKLEAVIFSLSILLNVLLIGLSNSLYTFIFINLMTTFLLIFSLSVKYAIVNIFCLISVITMLYFTRREFTLSAFNLSYKEMHDFIYCNFNNIEKKENWRDEE